MQSLQNFETLFLGLADARAGEHEFRGRYVCAESLLNPVPRGFSACRNPQKTGLSRERRACQNVQQSLKNTTGTDFENAGAVPEITKNWCPGGASRGVSGARWDRCPGGWGTPGRPRDAPATLQGLGGASGSLRGLPGGIRGPPRASGGLRAETFGVV